MSNEKKNDRDEVESMLDVHPRINDGPHTLVMCATALVLALIGLAMYWLHIIDMESLVRWWMIILVVVPLAIHLGYIIRQWLIGNTTKRRVRAVNRFTPETNATDLAFNASYDEPMQDKSSEGPESH